MVKNVAAVPSGPTKLNGPLTLLLPATWNFRDVFAGVAPFQDNVDQIGVWPVAGLASFTLDTNVPGVT